MDIETLAVAMKLGKRKILPAADPGDAGSVMVVGNDGKWTKGEVVECAITVEGHALVVTTAE